MIRNLLLVVSLFAVVALPVLAEPVYTGGVITPENIIVRDGITSHGNITASTHTVTAATAAVNTLACTGTATVNTLVVTSSTIGGGTPVTTITATLPLTVSGSNGTRTVAIQASSATTAGYMAALQAVKLGGIRGISFTIDAGETEETVTISPTWGSTSYSVVAIGVTTPVSMSVDNLGASSFKVKIQSALGWHENGKAIIVPITQ